MKDQAWQNKDLTLTNLNLNFNLNLPKTYQAKPYIT